MSDDESVHRLEEDAATHPAVRQALGALRQASQPSEQALERLRARLGTRLDQPPRGARVGLRLIVVGTLLLGALGAWLGHSARTPPQPKDVAPARSISPPVITALKPPERALPPARADVASQRDVPERPRKVARARKPDATPPHVPQEQPRESTTVPVEPTDATTISEERVRARTRQEGREEDEAQLLFRARAQLKTDPKTTLALVEQHRTRFPTAALAPEREVLAIEALRALGQRSAADALLRQFRARYPHSVYLPRLLR
jgi:hypothetical protein